MGENLAPVNFDQFVDTYDLLIDWSKRLSHEATLFRSVFAEAGAKCVRDMACGTGRHSAMFHEWGLNVLGADISPAMIARCRQKFGEDERLRWVVRSFDKRCDAPEKFDAVICIGNSLALVPDMTAAGRALSSMISWLRPGGVGVVQVLNLWRIKEGPSIWQKCVELPDEHGRRILLKGLHRVCSRGYIDLVDLTLTSSGLSKQFDAPHFIGIEAEELSAAILANGGRDVRLYGGYLQEPYDRAHSADLICVFRS